MILYILLALLLTTNGQLCTQVPIKCNEFTDSSSCASVRDLNQEYACYYNATTNACADFVKVLQTCTDLLNEYDCDYKTYGCVWDGSTTTNYDQTIMQANTDGKCKIKTCNSMTTEGQCSSFGNISCDWIDGNCVQITQCKEFKSVKGCRNTRFKEKCVAIVDGQVLSLEQKSVSSFQSMECVVQDCKHKSQQYDCTFVNGVQCIWASNSCQRCTDFTTYNTCIANPGLCRWSSNLCVNVECQYYTSPTTCKLKPDQCEWNQLKMRCQLNSTLSNQHCYSEYLSQQNYVQTLLFLSQLMLLFY